MVLNQFWFLVFCFGLWFSVLVFGSWFWSLVLRFGFWFSVLVFDSCMVLVFGSWFWFLVLGSGFWFSVLVFCSWFGIVVECVLLVSAFCHQPIPPATHLAARFLLIVHVYGNDGQVFKMLHDVKQK